MSDTTSNYFPRPVTMEQAHQNIEFQFANVAGWIGVKKYESALIKAQCLVDALQDAIALEKEK